MLTINLIAGCAHEVDLDLQSVEDDEGTLVDHLLGLPHHILDRAQVPVHVRGIDVGGDKGDIKDDSIHEDRCHWTEGGENVKK